MRTIRFQPSAFRNWLLTRRAASGESVRVGFLLILGFAFLSPAFAAEDRASRDYWLRKYPEVKDGALVARAQRVFTSVLAASDRRAGVEPSLHVIEYDGLPWAQSLADGSVIITRKALDFCLKGRPAQDGEARLAFVVGHELAHHFNGDFWPYRFLRAAQNQKGGAREFQDVETAYRFPETRLARELQADQNGILYAVLAGYDADSVIGKDRGFLFDWAEKTCPTPEIGRELRDALRKREKAVALRLREVSTKVPLFKMGVASWAAGRHVDALHLFHRFAETFPGREVFANIGAVHLSMAWGRFLEARSPESFPFVLTFGVDARTRAERVDVARGFSEGKYADYRETLKEAVRSFQKAIAYDPSYVPARNGLGCVRILENRYLDAVSVLEEAQKITPMDSGVRSNLAVARILLGLEVGSDSLMAKAEVTLRDLKEAEPAARENWNALCRLLGREKDVEWETAAEAKPASVDFRKFAGKEAAGIRPGTMIGAVPGWILLEDFPGDGAGMAVYSIEGKGVFVLVQGGKARLVLHRNARGMAPPAQAAAVGNVLVSRTSRNGVIVSGGRVRDYFEF